MKRLALTVFTLWAPLAGAQTMYKCVDAQKRITYSNTTCEKQGLKDAGPVADRTTPVPGVPAAAPSSSKTAPRPAEKASTAERDEFDTRGTTQVKPVVPLLERAVK